MCIYFYKLKNKLQLKWNRPGCCSPWQHSCQSKYWTLASQTVNISPKPPQFPWRRKWKPTPVFLTGKFHRQRSMVGYNPWGCKESDKFQHTHTHALQSHFLLIQMPPLPGAFSDLVTAGVFHLSIKTHLALHLGGWPLKQLWLSLVPFDLWLNWANREPQQETKGKREVRVFLPLVTSA